MVISMDDFQAMEETAYLLGTPANRTHLESSLKQVAEGGLADFSPDFF